MHPITEHLRNAVMALCEARVSKAEQELHAIDLPALRRDHRAAYTRVWKPGGLASGFKKRFPGTKRKDPSKAEKRTAFVRDCYTCRYSHCQRQTVSPDVLRLLSRVFTEVMPYHPNWLDRDKHVLYYAYSTNIEHLRSFPEIGPSAAAADNLITACYECGDIKNYLSIEALDWHVTQPADSDWAGLTEYIPHLISAVAALEASAIETPKA